MEPTAEPDLIASFHRKLRHLEFLKRIGEEPYEIEHDVTEAGGILAKLFTAWLRRNRHDYPEEFAEFAAIGLMRFLYLRESGRVSSPLTFGKSVQTQFVKCFVEELDLPKGSSVLMKEALRLFVDFRSTLAAC